MEGKGVQGHLNKHELSMMEHICSPSDCGHCRSIILLSLLCFDLAGQEIAYRFGLALVP